MTSRVLLSDDEEAITTTLAPYLERCGFSVLVAGDGEEALEALASNRIDIIVSDVLMPRLDGRAFVRELRRREDWTPVILLTQVGESFERSAALDKGADDYVAKPFDPPELVSRIRAAHLPHRLPGGPLEAAERRRRSGSALGGLLQPADERCEVLR